MPEKEAQVMKAPAWPSNCPRFTQPQPAVDNNEEQGLEMSREYVILKSSPAHEIASLTGNDYVYGLKASSDQLEEGVSCYISLCLETFSDSPTNILNQSYLQSEVGNHGTRSGHYTNLENEATAKKE